MRSGLTTSVVLILTWANAGSAWPPESPRAKDVDVSDIIEDIKRASDPEANKAGERLRVMREKALRPLLQAARDSKKADWETQEIAMMAIAGLGELGVRPKDLGKDADEFLFGMRAFVKDTGRDGRARLYSLYALNQLKIDWSAEVPFLIEILDDSDLYSPALSLLREAGPAAKPALPRLIADFERAQRRPFGSTSQVSRVLGAIGPAAKDAVPLLVKEVRGARGAGDRSEAAEALGKIGAQTTDVVPALVGALTWDESQHVQRGAATALGQIGAAAKEALPDLKRALENTYESVRKAAAEAIQKIEQPQKIEPK